MSLLRKIIRSNHLKPNQVRSQFLLPQHFSTPSDQQQQQQQQQRLNQDKAVDSILRQPPSQGNVYAVLSGIGTLTSKNDVMRTLESYNLTRQDIRVQYNHLFAPVCMLLRLPSHSAYITAAREIPRKSGKMYRIDMVEADQWGFESYDYDGKVVLLQGVPRNAVPEDIERTLSGCDFIGLQFFARRNFSDTRRFAMVEFPSQLDATNAVLKKNMSFCLSSQIFMRVLE